MALLSWVAPIHRLKNMLSLCVSAYQAPSNSGPPLISTARPLNGYDSTTLSRFCTVARSPELSASSAPFLSLYINTLKVLRMQANVDRRDFSVVNSASRSCIGLELGAQDLHGGHTTICNFGSKGSNTLSWHPQAQGMCVMHKHTCSQESHTNL